MLMVLHNPSNKNLQNNTNWDAWLHSNVGFRNYLEHVAYEIEDWTKEAERLEEEKTKQEAPQEPMEPSPVPPPIKERSRSVICTLWQGLSQKIILGNGRFYWYCCKQACLVLLESVSTLTVLFSVFYFIFDNQTICP